MKIDVIHLDFPANHKYLHLLGACITGMLERIEDLHDPKILTYNLQLAAQEACTNIVRHAYAGQLEGRINTKLTLEDSPRRLIIDLHDTGRSFNLDAIPEPDTAGPQVHGYGLYLMKQLLDEVVYHPEPGNNHWRLVKNL